MFYPCLDPDLDQEYYLSIVACPKNPFTGEVLARGSDSVMLVI